MNHKKLLVHILRHFSFEIITELFDTYTQSSYCNSKDTIAKPVCLPDGSSGGYGGSSGSSGGSGGGSSSGSDEEPTKPTIPVPVESSEGLYKWVKESCPENTKCNPTTDQCEAFYPEKNTCQTVQEAGFIPYIEYNMGFSNSEPIKVLQWCNPGDEEVEKVECNADEQGFTDLIEIETECPIGTGCNPKTMACEKPNYNLAACSGPMSKADINIYKKEKISATDQFGNQLFFFTEEGKIFNEDVCTTEIIPEEDENKLGQFWCQEEYGPDGKYYTIGADEFTCPTGTCKDGACI